MSEDEIHRKYILIHWGSAVATGGFLISLFQALLLILSSFGAALSRDLRGSSTRGPGAERPEPIATCRCGSLGAGSVGLVLAIWVTSPLHNLLSGCASISYESARSAVLIVLFGFLFVTVSSRF